MSRYIPQVGDSLPDALIVAYEAVPTMTIAFCSHEDARPVLQTL